MSITYDLEIENSPYKLKYTPDNNIIPCLFQIHFEKSETISHIQFGLCGHAKVRVQNRGANYYTSWRSYDFFDTFEYMDIDPRYQSSTQHGFQMYDIPANIELEKKCVLEFPIDKYLISSGKDFGGHVLRGKFEVIYSIYVKIYKIGGLLTKQPKAFKSNFWKVQYQSGTGRTENSNKFLHYELSEVFENKVKTFYYDDTMNALVPTALTKSHNNTKMVRHAWDKNYEDINYKEFTKSIPLLMVLDVNSNFDLRTPIIDQFNIILVSDLSYCNVDNNQTLDFVYNNQSTHLGVFQIESLTIKMKYHIKAKCGLYKFDDHGSRVVVDTKFDNLIIDLKDVDYDKENHRCKELLSKEKLMDVSSVNLNQSILNLLQDENIICSGDMQDWFTNHTELKFKWTVSDGLSTRKVFNFKTNATPDYLVY